MVGVRIRELERIYGIKHGNNQISTSNNFKSQENIAKDMGVTVQTLQNYKMLFEMIPELSDLVDTGIAKIIVLNKKEHVFENAIDTNVCLDV